MGRKEPISDKLREQLAILCNSQKLIRRVLLGIFLQHQALEVQKALLCLNEEETQSCPDPRMMQIAASVMVLSALFGFQKQGEEIVCQTACATGCADWTEPTLNGIVILVALIRLIRLAGDWNCPEPGTDSTEEENPVSRDPADREE